MYTRRLDSWGSGGSHDDDCCKWSGVECSNTSGHVTWVDLSWSYEGCMIDSSLHELQHLSYLNLSGSNHSECQIPSFIGNFTKPVQLDLSSSGFGGRIPDELGNLSMLEFLDLSTNRFHKSTIPESLGLLRNLIHLDISYSSIGGKIPYQFRNMSSLIYLDLSANFLEGNLPTCFGCTLPSLRYLALHNNWLKGDLSIGIRQLHKLRHLDLSSNSFHSVITENHLNNFSSLKLLTLDYNNLTLHLSLRWVPPFQLLTMGLGSCNLGPQFPSWIKTQTSLDHLDISSNKISETIPEWFWNLSSQVSHLNISNNELYGMVPNKLFFKSPIEFIDLSSNQFEGQIPLFSHRIRSINLSKNKFSGSLSNLCQFKVENLTWFDLSENYLSGELPNCWKKKGFESLFYINLSYNSLARRIPNIICSSLGRSIYVLLLRNNNFSRELPSSLSNCSNLLVLDVANNMISGSIPEWIGDHISLSILILRSNQFSGRLPTNLCWLQYIQVIDISFNNISGHVLDCLGNSSILTNKETTGRSYHDILFRIIQVFMAYNDKLVWKGIEYEYKSDNLNMKIVDFSGNNLQGEKPKEFSSLIALEQLNLSNNNLIGHIPHKIGEMSVLEVLDLSSNHLSGEIPQSIANLHFLAILNLSYNSLSGQIPIGTQIQSFSAVSFIGNQGLCGDPLPKKCEAPPLSSNFGGHEEEKDGFISKGFYISMGAGFVVGFWGMLGPLLFHNFWSSAYFRFLNRVADWIYVTCTLTIARIQRRLAR